MIKKKVLITGAGGYIGRHVVSALLTYDNVHVMVVDSNNKEIDPRAEFIKKDIFSGASDIFAELGSPDICIHLAWRDGFNHKSNYHLESFSSHFTFLKNMIDGGLKHLSVMGTMHEVGYHEGPINEDTICNPTSFYGISKNALRQAMLLYAKAKENIIMQWPRAYYIYGDDLNNHSVFTKLIQAEREGKEEFPFTSGSNKYDFITIHELAHQLAACVMQNEVSGIIECCSGEGVTLKDMVEAFILKNNFNIKLNYGAYPDREYDSPGVWGDATKIRRVLQLDTDARVSVI